MARTLTPFQFLAATMSAAILIVIVLVLLPHDPYIRFQQFSRESVHYLRAQWIYERIHFDGTPIDIAFIGTSHTQSGIDTEVIETSLRSLGKESRAVNFAIPHLGRDLEYLVARELLENRQIKTLVIEVQQIEARAPHPGFQRLASVADMLEAPLVINTGAIENLLRTPLREVELFKRSIFPEKFGLNNAFVNAKYEGPHFNDTYQLHGFSQPRTSVRPKNHFLPELKKIHLELQNKRQLADYFETKMIDHNPLYRYNNIYLKKIVDLAKSRSVHVVFLYLPFIDAPPKPEHAAWLETMGSILVPEDIIADASLWQNADHLNVFGARALSSWIAYALAR